MKTIAAHTLGCKVNQYDTEAMLELFRHSGYSIVPMDGDADVYLVNTCTVTAASKEDIQARDSSGPEDGSSVVRANIIVFLQSEETDKEEGAS